MPTSIYKCRKCGKTNFFDSERDPQLLIEGRNKPFEINEASSTKSPQVLIVTCLHCGERNRIQVY